MIVAYARIWCVFLEGGVRTLMLTLLLRSSYTPSQLLTYSALVSCLEHLEVTYLDFSFVELGCFNHGRKMLLL